MNLKRVQELLAIDGDFNYHKESGWMEFLWIEKHDGGYNEPCGEPVEKEEAVRTLNEYREGLKMLQAQNKELIKDAERLAAEIRDKLYPDNDGNTELVLHDKLMEKINGEDCQEEDTSGPRQDMEASMYKQADEEEIPF